MRSQISKYDPRQSYTYDYLHGENLLSRCIGLNEKKAGVVNSRPTKGEVDWQEPVYLDPCQLPAAIDLNLATKATLFR